MGKLEKSHRLLDVEKEVWKALFMIAYEGKLVHLAIEDMWRRIGDASNLGSLEITAPPYDQPNYSNYEEALKAWRRLPADAVSCFRFVEFIVDGWVQFQVNQTVTADRFRDAGRINVNETTPLQPDNGMVVDTEDYVEEEEGAMIQENNRMEVDTTIQEHGGEKNRKADDAGDEEEVEDEDGNYEEDEGDEEDAEGEDEVADVVPTFRKEGTVNIRKESLRKRPPPPPPRSRNFTTAKKTKPEQHNSKKRRVDDAIKPSKQLEFPLNVDYTSQFVSTQCFQAILSFISHIPGNSMASSHGFLRPSERGDAIATSHITF